MGNVTGLMHAASTSCFNTQSDVIPVAGTITSAGAFSAKSSPVSNQVLNLTAKISTDSTSLTSGTYTITGGSCAGDHGTFSGFQMAPLTANYSGNFTSGSTVITISPSALNQTPTADAQGLFHLAGTLTFSGSTCGLSSATIQSSLVAGEIVSLTFSGSDGVSTMSFAGQATDPAGANIGGPFSITGGAAAGLSGNATLTHP